MDLLGSILNSMDKPPSISNKEKEKIKKAREAAEQQQLKVKQKLSTFRADVQKKIDELEQSDTVTKLEFPPCDRIFRSIIHEIAHDADMATFSFGEDGVDRYIVVYKREHVPCEDELDALRRGEEWNEEKANELWEKRKREEQESIESSTKKIDDFVPASNYKEKYQHLIGIEAAKDAAKVTQTNKQYGFVPSANKKDSRSIEQTLADIQSRKKLKTDDN